MTIMLKNINAENDVDTKLGDDKEHSIKLTRNIYEALSARRLEISSLVSAHLVWDNDNSAIVLLGSDESVQQTACILSQYLSSITVPRRLVGRSLHSLHSLTSIHDSHQSLDEAKNLLLMSQLPPELSISSHVTGSTRAPRGMGGSGLAQFSTPGHTSLGRTLSDSSHVTKLRNKSEESRTVSNLTRRKLESEDSSYDSDHEYLAGTLSAEHNRHTQLSHVSKSHDDVTRSYSETLAQEFAEYVSIRPVESLLINQNENLYSSREASPVQLNRDRVTNKDSTEADFDSFDKDLYLQKVEFALKLGYAEELTRRALIKVGLTACNDDLLKELVRLQQSKVVDPKESLLKESCVELVQCTQAQQTSGDNVTRTTSSDGTNLRPIVIDGSNVAMSHGNSEKFSCRGIEICVDWFKERGHKDITVFLPSWRKETSKPESPMTSHAILKKLEKDKVLSYTPSRQFEGRRIAPHDDRYILNLASQNGAIVVSNDHYRELINEKKEFKKVIEERLLMYTFVGDRFMPPDDPLGRNGPTLDNFLKASSIGSGINPNISKPCPYENRCTYGNKCKYFHAERGNIPVKTVSDKLKEQSNRQILEVRTRKTSRDNSPGDTRSKDRLRRTESDVTAIAKKSPHPAHVSRTMSSRPLAYPGPDYYQLKSDVAKSNSADPGTKFHRDLRMASGSVPIQSEDGGWSNIEMGCLSNYGIQQPPPSAAWSGLGQFTPMLHQPPPPTAQHRKLERQLTINPSFDPRINKGENISPNRSLHQQQPILSSEAIEYMHRNPPPPFGLVNIAEQSESHHQNVTRNASAPDSIKHWTHEHGQMSGASVLPGPSDPTVGLSIRVDPPLQRLSSGSDTQLNRVMSPVNRALSADPFNTSDTWKFNKFDTGMTPLLGPSIWSNTAAPAPSQVSPPTSPARNLGPVGSRPGAQSSDETRAKQYQDLCNIFSKEQVDRVMELMPNEKDTQVLCKQIIKLYH